MKDSEEGCYATAGEEAIEEGSCNERRCCRLLASENGNHLAFFLGHRKVDGKKKNSVQRPTFFFSETTEETKGGTAILFVKWGFV